ncbi:unnamed protein product [Allacma fusca]|uniref:Uncharacterized protein n=1 Tax=Allacma fusca TaxID=39272 RepID=A0A8J2LD54_9HEXA|nr:unnamed protein product [Allacma fusca]
MPQPDKRRANADPSLRLWNDHRNAHFPTMKYAYALPPNAPGVEELRTCFFIVFFWTRAVGIDWNLCSVLQ